MLAGAQLTLDADVDGDGGDETGVFDLSTDVEITARPAADALVDSRGGTLQTLAQAVTGVDDSSAIRFDLGAGILAVDLRFIGFQGSAGRWGDGSTDPAADAEGESALRQLSVLTQYLDAGRFDSRSAATLEFAEYSSSGEYDALAVAPVDDPSLSFEAGDPSIVSGNISFVSLASLEQSAVSTEQDDR